MGPMRREQEGLWFLSLLSPSCLCPVSSRKMLGGLLLWLLLGTALCPGLLGTAPVQNLHLCEGYTGPDGRDHPGFYCPRLSDPPGHRYCCRPSPRALKSCCSQLALETLSGVNVSSLASLGLLRNPLALPFVGLYGLLVLLLMAVDLLHFYRTRRCGLARLLPRARRPSRTPSGGRQCRSRPPRSSCRPGGLRLPRGAPGREC